MFKIGKVKFAKNKTGQDSAVMIATGVLNGIEVTVGAINFEFIGGSVGSHHNYTSPTRFPSGYSF